MRMSQTTTGWMTTIMIDDPCDDCSHWAAKFPDKEKEGEP